MTMFIWCHDSRMKLSSRLIIIRCGSRATQQHIPISFGNRLLGTARFASINNHRGVQLSRRDDIEAIAYMIIYFLRGKLPWQDLKAETKKKKYSLIKAEKEVTMQRLPNFQCFE